MKSQKKWIVAAAAVIAAGTLSLASVAGAAEVELRLSHWVPPTHPIQPTGMEPWAESIKEDSGGRINITIFPAQQLGAAPDHYDMARDGIVDLSFVNPGYNAGRFPIVALTEIPFLVKNASDGAAAMHEWYAKYAGEEMPDVKVCVMTPHDPGTFHSKVPVHVPADVSGKTVRPANATIARFVSLLGGAAVQVPAPEAREALANGVAEAMTFPWNSLYLFGIDQILHEHLDMPFYVSQQMTVMSKLSYDRLSEEDRKVIDEHCTPEWSKKFSDGWAKWEAAGRQKMVDDSTHHLYEPTEEEIALWREAAKPLLEEWKKAVEEKGYDADQIYDEYVAALKKHDALY
ncbi:TRAP transporter substrate-binding protein [Afifella sp. IM 167]|uniref:TRAP transporter substrate-binding protein n=1 Tax=Afifella sp. IM 167 TaxID=2033586 RepID=UPI001CCCB621|nr:TRAP transporter substrate-binding protein [Afifella sp. IM 167]MBZ8132138.1 C4-dicarboxylate ABC transporter [Afifella sp. IM 167]